MTDQPPREYYPEDSQATLSLVLGILGIVICGVLAPFAWVIGNNEVSAIDAGRRDPSNRGMGQAGKILGIIGTVLLIIGVIVGVLVLLFAVVATTTTS